MTFFESYWRASVHSPKMLGKAGRVNVALAAFFACQALAQQASVFSKTSNDSLLWGPYRPNLYFGVRPRLPKSLSLGMLWGRAEEFEHIAANLRYTCEQHEGMAGYGWDAYDARKGGVQMIHDRGNGLDIETSFVKISEGAWAARIKGSPREEGSDRMKSTVFLTLALEGSGSLEVQDAEQGEELGFEGDVVFSGNTPDLGDFDLKIIERGSNKHPVHSHPTIATKPLDRTFVHSIDAPEEALWQGKRKSRPSRGSSLSTLILTKLFCSARYELGKDHHR